MLGMVYKFYVEWLKFSRILINSTFGVIFRHVIKQKHCKASKKSISHQCRQNHCYSHDVKIHDQVYLHCERSQIHLLAMAFKIQLQALALQQGVCGIYLPATCDIFGHMLVAMVHLSEARVNGDLYYLWWHASYL